MCILYWQKGSFGLHQAVYLPATVYFLVRTGLFSLWPWRFHAQLTFSVCCSRLLSHLTTQPGFSQSSLVIFQETPGMWCMIRVLSLFWQATQVLCWCRPVVVRLLETWWRKVEISICSHHLRPFSSLDMGKMYLGPLTHSFKRAIKLHCFTNGPQLCLSLSGVPIVLLIIKWVLWQAVRLCKAVSLDLVSICYN